jgi:hypothetical protein
MLTTVDNPYNPFTQYDEWLAMDEALGYFTNGLLARYAILSDDLSDVNQTNEIDSALLQVIQDNPYGVHKMVERQDVES